MSGVAATWYRVGALARRDARIELSYHFQLVLRVFTLGISVVMFFYLDRLVGSSPALAGYEGSYFEFVLIGLVVTGFAMTCVNTFGKSIMGAQNDGTFEILLATTAPLSTLMAGTLVVPLALALVDAIVVLGLGWLLSGDTFRFLAVLTAIPLLLLTLGTFCAVGILSASVIVLTKRGDPFSALTLQASSLLAGALFPVALLPVALQALAKLVPAYWGLQGLREALLNDAGLADVVTELAVLTAFNVVLLPAAMWLLSRALRVARVTGTLGNR